MRFTAAIISASALASIGVQSAPSPQEVSAEKWGGQSLPEPARTCKCEPPKTPTPRPPSPPPQRKCVDYCVFYNWDLSQNVRTLTTYLKEALTVTRLDLTDLKLTRRRLVDQLNPRTLTDVPKIPPTSTPSESAGAFIQGVSATVMLMLRLSVGGLAPMRQSSTTVSATSRTPRTSL